MKIPFVPLLRENARELRNDQTKAEKILWKTLRKRNILGYRFLRQKPLLSYIVDFYCFELFLAIEIDGLIHEERKEADEMRTSDLESIGITVIRYTNDQILFDLPGVLQDLKKNIHFLENHKTSKIHKELPSL